MSLGIVFLGNIPQTVRATDECGKGNVKANWTESGWVYESGQNDGSATVGGNQRTVTWSAASGFTITNVCIKYATIYERPNVSSGSWTTPSHDISHIVISTGSITPTPIVTPTITPTATPTVTPTATPTITPSATPSETPSPTPTATPTITPSPSATATPTVTPSTTPTPVPCILTDLKGRLEYTGNHISGNPVVGYFDNIAENLDCSDSLYYVIYGSNLTPETEGWLEAQTQLTSGSINVPQGSTDLRKEITVPDRDFCWYQVDVVRTSEVRSLPMYSGDEMVDYVFVEDANSCNPEPTPSGSANPTPSVEPSPTVTPSATPSTSPDPEAGKHTILGKNSATCEDLTMEVTFDAKEDGNPRENIEVIFTYRDSNRVVARTDKQGRARIFYEYQGEGTIKAVASDGYPSQTVYVDPLNCPAVGGATGSVLGASTRTGGSLGAAESTVADPNGKVLGDSTSALGGTGTFSETITFVLRMLTGFIVGVVIAMTLLRLQYSPVRR